MKSDPDRRDRLVPWVTLGTLLRTEVPAGPATALAEGVRLVPVPDWMLRTDGLEYVSGSTRQSLREFKSGLVVEYQADSFGMPDPAWGRDEEGHPRSIQDHAERKLIFAALALWLVHPTCETIENVIHARNDDGHWFAPKILGGTHVVRPHPRDADEHLNVGDFRHAAPLHAALLALREDGPLFVALSALMQGLRATTTTIRFLMCWVAAEAIFGSGQEVTFRLSARVSALLRSNGPDREAIFKTVKQGYGWRSRVVHGTGLAKFTHEDWLRESHALETWFREALRKILLDESMTRAIEGGKREDFLDGLQFS